METKTTTTTTCSKYCKPKGVHGPAAAIYSSKGLHSFCERHSNIFRVVTDFVDKFKPNLGKHITMSTYTSLNTKPSQAQGLPQSGKRPTKRALLCGVTYNHKRKYLLKGTVNDVVEMRKLLMEQFAYPADCIRVLTEFEQDKEFQPTKKNIESSLKWLVEGCQSGDSLVFYFSGHGLRQPDFKNDERDGFDETICPVDFMEEGMIFDNDINTTIVRPLKEGVTLHAIVDACHSGTILDLEFVYDYQNSEWKDNSPPSGAPKGTSGGLAICLSACEDHQLAADTTAYSGKKMTGASTYIFIELIRHNPHITYKDLLDSLSETFDKNAQNQVKCLNSRRIARLFGRKINQKPLLSSSAQFDICTKTFSL